MAEQNLATEVGEVYRDVVIGECLENLSLEVKLELGTDPSRVRERSIIRGDYLSRGLKPNCVYRGSVCEGLLYESCFNNGNGCGLANEFGEYKSLSAFRNSDEGGKK